MSPKSGSVFFFFFFFVGLVLMYFSCFQVPHHKKRRGYRIRGEVDLSTETLPGPQTYVDQLLGTSLEGL